jgi:predicted nuclease of predicted toxin-antitoxin system
VKLLFDHNVSPSLVSRLGDAFPNCEHVFNLQLHEEPDLRVWFYARDHGFSIVSKDADFAELSMQHGFPPKLIWLRIGNCSTFNIERLIRSSRGFIAAFDADTEEGILSLYARTAG